MVVIDASSAEAQQTRLREAAAMMSMDFGDFSLPTDYRAFLSIGPDARLRGCTVAHPITTAYRAVLASGTPVGGAGASTTMSYGSGAVGSSDATGSGGGARSGAGDARTDGDAADGGRPRVEYKYARLQRKHAILDCTLSLL